MGRSRHLRHGPLARSLSSECFQPHAGRVPCHATSSFAASFPRFPSAMGCDQVGTAIRTAQVRPGGCQDAPLVGQGPDYCVTALHLGRFALIQGALGACPRGARRGRIFLACAFHLDGVCALHPIEHDTSNKSQTRKAGLDLAIANCLPQPTVIRIAGSQSRFSPSIAPVQRLTQQLL